MAISRELSWLSRAVAGELRALLAGNGITQTQIAQHLGRSQAYVSERIRGLVPCDLDDLDGIAELLGMNGLDLLLDVVRRGRIDEIGKSVSGRRGRSARSRSDELAEAAYDPPIPPGSEGETQP